MKGNFVKWLNEIREQDADLVGGKATNLAKMLNAGFYVPFGFCITTNAFSLYLSSCGLSDISHQSIKCSSIDGILSTASRIKERLKQKPIPDTIERETLSAYHLLIDKTREDILVAVRSSATAEDVKTSSFAGQLRTYLGVQGDEDLLEKVKKCWMAGFTDRVILYCSRKGINPFHLKIGIIVQEMVDSDKAGVLFTTHPYTGDTSKIVIEANWGQGESIVSGIVTPDSYIVDKKSLKILEQKISTKKRAITMATTGTRIVDVPKDKQNIPCLSKEELEELTAKGIKTESLYSFPQDIEWAISKGKVYILQSRPITT